MDPSDDIPPLPHATTSGVTGFEVSGYSCSGDPNFLDNHVYNIRIWVAQDNYTIRRSYASFCIFDHLLRKKYARTQFPAIPLSGAPLFARSNRRKSATSSATTAQSISHTRRSTMGIRHSFHGLIDGSRKPDVKRTDASEAYGAKRDALTKYLKALVAIPVIALSGELTDFFDEESPDGFEFERPELSEIDMLLLGEDAERVKVKTALQVPLHVDAGAVVVWKFTTERKDIGFSVEFAGQVAAPYQRCNCHEQAVTGVFEAPSADKVTLIWDNSYSKIHSKMLSYYVKVVTRGEFDHIKATLGELIRQQHVFDVRRKALRAAFEKICEKMIISGADDSTEEASLHSMTVLSTIGAGGPMSSGQARGGSSLLSELQQEIHRLQDEDRSMRMELSSTQFLLNQRNEEVDSLREEHERTQAAVEAFDTERSELQAALDEAKGGIEHEKNRRLALEQQIESMRREQLLLHTDEVARMKRDFDALAEERAGMEVKCNQLRLEKKQLKAAAIKFKADLEVAEKKIEELKKAKEFLDQQNKALQSNISSQVDSSPAPVCALDSGNIDFKRTAESGSSSIAAQNQAHKDNDAPQLASKPPLMPTILVEGNTRSNSTGSVASICNGNTSNNNTVRCQDNTSNNVHNTKKLQEQRGRGGRKRIMLENSFGF